VVGDGDSGRRRSSRAVQQSEVKSAHGRMVGRQLHVACSGRSGRAAVTSLGAAEPNDFFVIFTISHVNYTNDPISLIELNILILLANSCH
jgi:hypothetical protein